MENVKLYEVSLAGFYGSSRKLSFLRNYVVAEDPEQLLVIGIRKTGQDQKAIDNWNQFS